MYFDGAYHIMNKDEVIAVFTMRSDQFGDVLFEMRKIYGKLPYGFSSVSEWLSGRRAPKHREHIEELLKTIGCDTLPGFVNVSHASGLNDTFWVKRADCTLSWHDVSLYQNDFDETIARIAFEGGMYGEQFSVVSPELVTDGMFAKCWIREKGQVFLLKRGSSGGRNTGFEPYCEMHASQIAEKICPESVKYETVKFRGAIASKCHLFTSEEVGYCPIYKVLRADQRGIGDMLRYFSSIDSGDTFRRMLVFDALTINPDRHYGNFGVLFDNDTMDVLKIAPVFDFNRALLPLSEVTDFLPKNINFLRGETPKIGLDFNRVAHELLTPSIIRDLKELRGFKFQRNLPYALPEDKLVILDQLVNMQIDNILKGKELTEDADISISFANVESLESILANDLLKTKESSKKRAM